MPIKDINFNIDSSFYVQTHSVIAMIIDLHVMYNHDYDVIIYDSAEVIVVTSYIVIHQPDIIF